jgi:O-succinylbenzoic acid--CoA ligase
MDHPVGQLWAAVEAARWPHPHLPAGLLTHSLFEPDEFTEAICSDGPHLIPPTEPGLGFGKLLDRLPWQSLGGPATVFFPSPATAPGEPLSWRPDGPGILLSNPRTPLPEVPPPDAIPRGHLVFPTSGSTGSGPSLVCLSMPAFLANAAAVNAWLGAGRDDTWLRALPTFHVGGLAIHARAHLADSGVVIDHDRWNPLHFTNLVAAHHITLASLVPAQLHDLVTARLPAPRSLRAVLVGGGPLSSALASDALGLGWPILATYGMTEASSQIATACPHGDPLDLRLLPCWEARTEADGRLAIRGAPLLSGFLRLERGTWHVAPARAPDGFFLTNDRARLAGRSLQFLGRTDRTVKVLGELVDLDAVENTLTSAGMPPHAGCVLSIPNPRSGQQLVLLTDAAEATARTWLNLATPHLPPFARISSIQTVPELPRSPLGKILRSHAALLLPRPSASGSSSHG